MRGPDTYQERLYRTVVPEGCVRAGHPLRPIRAMVDKALDRLDADFAVLYAEYRRPLIAPEKLLRAQLLMALHTIRSDRQLVEQLDCNLLFRWLVGFSLDDEKGNHSTISKNQNQQLEGEIAHRFFDEVRHQAEAAGLLTKEHFRVDGTPLEALASHKSYRPKDGNGPPGGDRGDCHCGLSVHAAQVRDARIEDQPGCVAVSQIVPGRQPN